MTEFSERIQVALSCHDCDSIPKVSAAGETTTINDRRFQIMHNGVLVPAGGYYGDWTIELIRKLKGHHEPQEEFVFHEVLKCMPENAVMLELGCYWAYYSAWFSKRVINAQIYPVEPVAHRLAVGEETLKINRINANITRAAIGAHSREAITFSSGAEVERDVPQVSVDDFIAAQGINHVHMLHADIQGYEKQMLDGAEHAFANRQIDWVFISTHRFLEDGLHLDLHQHCLSWLEDRGYVIAIAHTPEESFSVDGLIVARSPYVTPIPDMKISRRLIDTP